MFDKKLLFKGSGSYFSKPLAKVYHLPVYSRFSGMKTTDETDNLGFRVFFCQEINYEYFSNEH